MVCYTCYWLNVIRMTVHQAEPFQNGNDLLWVFIERRRPPVFILCRQRACFMLGKGKKNRNKIKKYSSFHNYYSTYLKRRDTWPFIVNKTLFNEQSTPDVKHSVHSQVVVHYDAGSLNFPKAFWKSNSLKTWQKLSGARHSTVDIWYVPTGRYDFKRHGAQTCIPCN